MARGDVDDGYSILLVFGRVADGEGDAIALLRRVCRLVAWRGVDRFEPEGVSGACIGGGRGLLLAQEVAEVGNGVVGVPDKLTLGLSTVELFSLDVGQSRRYLPVAVLVRNYFGLSFLVICQYRLLGGRRHGSSLRWCRQWSCRNCQRTARLQPAARGRLAHSSLAAGVSWWQA